MENAQTGAPCPPSPDGPRWHRLDALAEQLEAASLVEHYTDEDGEEAMRLTSEGDKSGRQLSMLGEDGGTYLWARYWS